jgi:hypothetical protein
VVGLAAVPAPAQAAAAVDVVAAVQRQQAHLTGVARLGSAPGGAALYGGQIIDVFDVGTTTFGQLFKVSKPFRQMLGGRLNTEYSRMTLHWGISTDLSGRPVIVQAIWRPGEGYPMRSVAVATRFSWNVKATAIKAPRAGGTARDPYGDDVIDFFRSRR